MTKNKLIDLENIYKNLLESIGEDINREGLLLTPKRAAKGLLDLTNGYEQKTEDVLNNAVFKSDIREMILVKNIEFYSLCEHHILPFFGKCHIGYMPTGKIIGVSKIPRLINLYAKRLQVQEHLTVQIALALKQLTAARGVGVVIDANHMCMMMRGVEKQNPIMTTTHMLGCFKTKLSVRSEFLSLIKI